MWSSLLETSWLFICQGVVEVFFQGVEIESKGRLVAVGIAT
jgi:hypothetical protein